MTVGVLPKKQPIDPRLLLTDSERGDVERAIAEAESRTSAELKLVIVRHCWGDIQEKLLATFQRLKLDQTAKHNAVMIMVVTANRQLSIYGDRGIHEQVGENFWFDVRDEILDSFGDGRFGDGLCTGIRRIGQKLATAFPYEEADENEISDNVAFEP